MRVRARATSRTSLRSWKALGHSLEAATRSRSGTGRDTPPPWPNVRPFGVRKNVLRMARLASNTSSRKATSASGRRPAVTRTNRSSRKAGERDGTVQFVGPGEFGEQAGEPAAVEEAGDGVQQKRFGGAGRADEKDVFTGHQGGRQVAAGLGELVADRVGGRVGRG